MIVSDAGPIIIFARIGQLSLLHEVTGSLLIPDAVYDVVKKGGMPDAAEAAQAAWIQKTSVANRSIIDGLPNVLHEGEREVIALAKERRTQLLVDEIRARRVASDQGVEVIGTLRILADAKQFEVGQRRSPDHRADAIKRIPIRTSFDSTIPRAN